MEYNKIEEKQIPSVPIRTTVWDMFDSIAQRYDLLNHLLSCRFDSFWRNKITKQIPEKGNLIILDVATGTGNILITVLKRCKRVKCAVGIDRALKMLQLGRKKLNTKRMNAFTILIPGDGHTIPFNSFSFDIVTIAFGIRNMSDVETALQEMHRVLKKDGKLIVLEFSLPKNDWVRRLYLLYLHYGVPIIGKIVSKDVYAYRYLGETIETFPYGEQFCIILKNAGFANVESFPLTFGIVTIYCANKK